MSTTLMRVPLFEGSEEFVEVEVDTRTLGEAAVQLIADGDGRSVRAPFSLAESMKKVLPALSTILTTLRSSAHAPDEISMELGLTLGGETGIVFAKGTAEATFTVTMTWQKPPVPATTAATPLAPATTTATPPAPATLTSTG